MTDTEDYLLDRLNGQTKLLLLWQLLAAFTCFILVGINIWFWIPTAAAMLGALFSGIEILWLIPRLRRAVWELGGQEKKS